ncbi:hypothetical protein GCM10027060_26430 [Nesterenkonia halophila]
MGMEDGCEGGMPGLSALPLGRRGCYSERHGDFLSWEGVLAVVALGGAVIGLLRGITSVTGV